MSQSSPIPVISVTDNNNDDLVTLKAQINRTTDESLESTRRMLNLCEESKNVGIRTLVTLDDQGETLDLTENELSQMTEDMKLAETYLEEMDTKCCGLVRCVRPWKKYSVMRKSSKKYEDDGKVKPPKPGVSNEPIAPPYGGYVARITNDRREEEMEVNMGQVASMVGSLRSMAIDIENELDSQNKQLIRIQNITDTNEISVNHANKKVGKHLHVQL